MLGAYGFLSKVFEIFKNYQTSVDLIATSEVSISLTIDNTNNLPHLLNELQEFSSVTVTSNQAIISAVGDGIKETAGLASRYFGILNDINIQMVSIGASEVNISVVVNSADMEKALNLLHNEFFTNINEPSVFE
jgi:aspartate kinase